MVDLGDDFSCIDDVDLNLTEVSGRRAVAEAVARRWLTRRGSLFYDASYGYGLEDALHQPASALGTLSAGLENEALRDERVLQARVLVRLDDKRQLLIRAELVDADGPFRLVASVSEVSVELLIEEMG